MEDLRDRRDQSAFRKEFNMIEAAWYRQEKAWFRSQESFFYYNRAVYRGECS